MRALVLSLLATLLVLVAPAESGASRLASLAPQPPAGLASLAPQPPAFVVLDGVRVRLRADTRQVVTVRHTHGWHARVALHRLGPDGWREVRATSDGRTGYGGLVPGARRRQDTGTTPLGTYALTSTFGTHEPRAAWSLPHRRIRRGDYWVQDNRSRFYNTYRNIRLGGFRPQTSERLTDYGVQYEHVVVMDYNPRRVRHRGSGIFLHVNGSGATAGCVSAPRRFLAGLMVRLDPALHPVIAIGR